MTRVLSFFVAILFASTVAFAGDGSIQHRPHPVPNSYIVVLDDNYKDSDPIDNALEHIFSGGGVKVTSVWRHALRGFAIEATEARAVGISKLPFVTFVEENGEVTAAAATARSWNIDRIDNTVNPRLARIIHGDCGTGRCRPA